MTCSSGFCSIMCIVGCLQVREIYESAIEAEEPYGLPDEDCKKLCLK